MKKFLISKTIHFDNIHTCDVCINQSKIHTILHLQWLCGFTDNDGSLHGIIRKQKDYKNNFQVQVVFDLAEKKTIFIDSHLKNINNYFFADTRVISVNKNMYHLKIVSINKHVKYIIFFFLSINCNLENI